jgi:hypothetical protein
MLERGSSLAEHGIMPIDDFETVLFEHSRVDEGSKRLRDETLTAAACLIPVAVILPKSFVNAIMSLRIPSDADKSRKISGLCVVHASLNESTNS